jgi:dienelactone hydrolase
MNFQRVTDLFAPDGHVVPALLFSPDSPCGGAILCPGYGGTKEHMLALAAAIAEKGIAALSIDLCGHGQNMAAIGPAMLDELEAGVRYLRRFGRVAAVGISLGGRLALMSSADCMVAISPAVAAKVSPQGQWMFENFPSPTVREPYSGYVFELLDALGPVSSHNRPCLLLYAERDIPALLDGAAGLKAVLPGAELQYVTTGLRPDVQHEHGLIRYLPRWFNHSEIKFNAEMLRTVSSWLAAHDAGSQGLNTQASLARKELG